MMESATSPEELPPRVAALRDRLVASIPCVPATDDVRAELRAMPFSRLMVTYVNYANRFIPPRVRQVGYISGFWTNRLAQDHIADVLAIEREFREGVDPTFRLSDRAQTEGYASSSHKWADKDFALNAYDVHHLHLGAARKTGSRIKRTRPLLYVAFRRHTAAMIMVGDHNSFDDGSLTEAVGRYHSEIGLVLRGCLPSREQKPARETNRLARYGFSTTLDVDNQVTMSASLMSSGHGMHAVRHADRITRTIQAIEPQLHDKSYVQHLFGQHAARLGPSPRFNWYMDYLDLLLVDEESRTAAIVVQGR